MKHDDYLIGKTYGVFYVEECLWSGKILRYYKCSCSECESPHTLSNAELLSGKYKTCVAGYRPDNTPWIDPESKERTEKASRPPARDPETKRRAGRMGKTPVQRHINSERQAITDKIRIEHHRIQNQAQALRQKKPKKIDWEFLAKRKGRYRQAAWERREPLREEARRVAREAAEARRKQDEADLTAWETEEKLWWECVCYANSIEDKQREHRRRLVKIRADATRDQTRYEMHKILHEEAVRDGETYVIPASVGELDRVFLIEKDIKKWNAKRILPQHKYECVCPEISHDVYLAWYQLLWDSHVENDFGCHFTVSAEIMSLESFSEYVHKVKDGYILARRDYAEALTPENVQWRRVGKRFENSLLPRPCFLSLEAVNAGE